MISQQQRSVRGESGDDSSGDEAAAMVVGDRSPSPRHESPRIRVSDLSAKLFKLKTMKALNLSNNRLTRLPVELRKATGLQSLDLYQNRLVDMRVEIPVLIALSGSLEVLNLGSNKLELLPMCLGSLERLTQVCV